MRVGVQCSLLHCVFYLNSSNNQGPRVCIFQVIRVINTLTGGDTEGDEIEQKQCHHEERQRQQQNQQQKQQQQQQQQEQQQQQQQQQHKQQQQQQPQLQRRQQQQLGGVQRKKTERTFDAGLYMGTKGIAGSKPLFVKLPTQPFVICRLQRL